MSCTGFISTHVLLLHKLEKKI